MSEQETFQSTKIPNFQYLYFSIHLIPQLEMRKKNSPKIPLMKILKMKELNHIPWVVIILHLLGSYFLLFFHYLSSEIIKNRYVIIQKLGWGHFSTVWLAKDFKFDNYVAMKIQKSAPRYLETAIDELEILQTIKKKSYVDCHVVQLLNAFIHKGPFGTHFVMVFEILGVNLLEVMKKQNVKGMAIGQCKSIIRQVLLGLDFLHRNCGIIHTDIKPENILVCFSAQEIKEIVESGQISQSQKQIQRVKVYQQIHGVIEDNEKTRKQKKQEKKKRQKKKRQIDQYRNQGRNFKLMDQHSLKSKLNSVQVKIADLGNGCWINYHFTDLIQTRYYRAPEVILGQYYGQAADIWSLGCLLFEIVTGDYLFDPHRGPNYSKNDDHLAQVKK